MRSRDSYIIVTLATYVDTIVFYLFVLYARSRVVFIRNKKLLSLNNIYTGRSNIILLELEYQLVRLVEQYDVECILSTRGCIILLYSSLVCILCELVGIRIPQEKVYELVEYQLVGSSSSSKCLLSWKVDELRETDLRLVRALYLKYFLSLRSCFHVAIHAELCFLI